MRTTAMNLLRTLLLLAVLATPLSASAAIQFDFMDLPWALGEASRDKLVDKLKEIDFDELKEDFEEAKDSIPDEVKELPGKALDKFEEEGIDAEGAVVGIWDTFSNLGRWMLTTVVDLFSKD